MLIAGVLVMPSARETARRVQCADNLRQFAAAVEDYGDNGPSGEDLPPPYVADANGKPMHSWRVLLLPYLGEKALYDAYDFDEPWDGPNNSKLAARMPEVFRCPSQHEAGQPDTETNYFAVVGPETMWPEDRRIRHGHVADGLVFTLMLIEVRGLGISWMEPRDVTFEEAMDLLTTKPRSGHTVAADGLLTTTYYETASRNIVLGDGTVIWLGQFSDAGDARALLTRIGRDHPPDFMNKEYVETKATTVVKWDKVVALGVLVVLALLPLAWLGRRPKRAETAQHS